MKVVEAKSKIRERRCRHTRLGSVVLSPDFYIALPLAFTSAIPYGINEAARMSAQTILIGAGTLGAAIATLTLTSLAMLVGVIGDSSGYHEMLGETQSGVRGAIRPFRIVVYTAAISAVYSFALVGFMPIIEIATVTYLVISLSLFLVFWSLFGCIQLVSQLVLHLELAKRADKIQTDRKRLGLSQ